MSLTGENSAPSGRGRLEALLRAALDLTSEHDVGVILQRVVNSAAEVAGARYAALGVYNRAGSMERFVHHGMDAETAKRIGHLPEGRGLLGELIVADGPIRLADLATDPRSCGFPPHHPPMRSFLGVPLRLGPRRFGNLYLTEKRGGGKFDAEDERMVTTLATFASAAIEGAVLVAAERDRADARLELAAAQERARAHAEMLAHVIEAQEAERARVARDLHDQIGQALTSVLLALKLVTDSLSREPPDILDSRARADEVRTLVADALQDVRQLAYDLRPSVLDDIGLVPAVRRLTDDLAARHGVAVDLELGGFSGDTRFAAEIETVVYRIVQEALTNVARHAHASRASVSFVVTGDCLRARVVDDGAGFNVPTGPIRSLGLAGMTERAGLVGGTVNVTSGLGAGTTVVLEVPLA
jgi:signal transduction histidine kinase